MERHASCKFKLLKLCSLIYENISSKILEIEYYKKMTRPLYRCDRDERATYKQPIPHAPELAVFTSSSSVALLFEIIFYNIRTLIEEVNRYC